MKTYFVTGSKSQVYTQLFVRLSVGLRPTLPHTDWRYGMFIIRTDIKRERSTAIHNYKTGCDQEKDI